MGCEMLSLPLESLRLQAGSSATESREDVTGVERPQDWNTISERRQVGPGFDAL